MLGVWGVHCGCGVVREVVVALLSVPVNDYHENGCVWWWGCFGRGSGVCI